MWTRPLNGTVGGAPKDEVKGVQTDSPQMGVNNTGWPRSYKVKARTSGLTGEAIYAANCVRTAS
jgi:hypothetical protein